MARYTLLWIRGGWAMFGGPSKGPAAALRIGALANTPINFNLETLKYEKLR